jgi:hypothetical protein
MPIMVRWLPSSAAPRTYTGGWGSERARSADVTMTAAPNPGTLLGHEGTIPE